MKDIIDRLEDPEQYVDAVDDAINEIQYLRRLLLRCLVFVKGNIEQDIQEYFFKLNNMPSNLEK